jgi:hypothetical protein
MVANIELCLPLLELKERAVATCGWRFRGFMVEFKLQ